MSELARRLVLPGSPFELISMGSIRVFRHAPLSLTGVWRRIRSSGTRPCLIFRGHTLSYADILYWADGLALTLRERYGIAVGQRVGIVLPTCPQWLMAFISITSIGGVATLIEPNASPERMVSALVAASCVAVIADESAARRLADFGLRCPIMVARIGERGQELFGAGAPFDDVEPQAHWPDPDRAIDPEQEALIAFTSGSTGNPKGVVSSHRAVITGMMNMMLGGALAAARSSPPQPGSGQPRQLPSSLLLAPLAHIAGYSHLLLMLWVSGKVAMLPTWQLDEALELIEQEKLRTITGINADLLNQLLRSDPRRHDLGSISAVGVHGCALRPALLREIQERLPGAAPVTGYGTTELNGSICVAAGREVILSPHSCGPVVPSVDARILDEDGRELSAGAVGEIWVRGAMLMSGYCPAPTQQPTLQDGWYRTGDWGSLDAHGNLVLAGRHQDFLSVCGSRLSYASLERLVCEFGSFDDAAVLFMEEGHRSRLVVYGLPGRFSTANAAQVAERLSREDGLPDCEIDVRIVGDLPRTLSGKIDRYALRCLPNNIPT